MSFVFGLDVSVVVVLHVGNACDGDRELLCCFAVCFCGAPATVVCRSALYSVAAADVASTIRTSSLVLPILVC